MENIRNVLFSEVSIKSPNILNIFMEMRGRMSQRLTNIFFVLFLRAMVLAQPLNLILPNNGGNLTFGSGFGVCSSHLTPALHLPTFSDCKKVIERRLPYFPGKATFHNTGADDHFKLPISEEWGSCAVTVVIGGGGNEDSSSWLDIKYAATEVNEVCQVGDYTGGKIQAGARDKIWIKLTHSRVESDDAVAPGEEGGAAANVATS